MLLSAETVAKVFFLFTSCTKAVIVSQLKGGRGSGKKMLNTLNAKQANRQQRRQEQQRGRKKPTD